MKNPNPDILLYIAIADAYAAAAEYVRGPGADQAIRDCLAFKGYVGHPTHDGIVPGRYTDDAEMSIANAKVLLMPGRPTALSFANAYVDEFIFGGRRVGYAGRFHDFLLGATDGADFLRRIQSRSDKNGAAMRSAVLGVLPSVAEVLDIASLQARITHDTPEGIFSSQAVALMSHYALYEDGPLRNIGAYCLAHLPPEYAHRFGYVFSHRWTRGSVRSYDDASVAITTVHAVADLVMHQSSLMGMLAQTIRWGGDTDSVAAIAWGIASARYRDERLPVFMTTSLEPGSPRTGVPYLCGIGTVLMHRYAS